MPTINPVRRFGGVPFVEPSFEPGVALAAVVAVRSLRTGIDAATQRDTLLDPTLNAATRTVEGANAIASVELLDQQCQQITEAKSEIVRTIASWAKLFALPITYRLMTRPGVISASSFGYPQHIFLAPEAFATSRELAEQLIHETAHNWIYLIAEVVQLEEAASHRPDFTLPSGTSGKAPSEIMGAIHVALSLRRYYLARLNIRPDARDSKRVATLSSYLAGCRALAEAASPYLTDAGKGLLEQMVRHV